MVKRLKTKFVQLLRWSEKYTKTDMVYLTKGSFWLMLGYGAQMLSGLILVIAFTNLLPKEVYGVYQFIISVSAIIAGFTLSGIGTALMRTVAQGAEGTLLYAFKVQLKWSIGIIFASIAVSVYYFLNNNTMLGTAFLIVGAFAPLLSGFSLYRPYLEGKQLFRESTLLGIWRKPIPVIAIIIALFLTDNPVILIFTYFASQTISMGLLYQLVISKYPEKSQSNPKLLNYSKHLSVMGLVGLLTTHIDKIIVFHFLGAVPVAVYTLAMLPYTHLKKMFSLISNLVFPKFAKREFAIIKTTITRKVAIYFLACAGTAVVYVIAAPYIFALIFPKYQEAVLLSQILILVILVKPFTLYYQAFVAHGLKEIQYFIIISSSIVKIVLLLILLPTYGLLGAVWALIGMNIYWSILTITLFYTRKI